MASPWSPFWQGNRLCWTASLRLLLSALPSKIFVVDFPIRVFFITFSGYRSKPRSFFHCYTVSTACLCISVLTCLLTESEVALLQFWSLRPMHDFRHPPAFKFNAVFFLPVFSVLSLGTSSMSLYVWISIFKKFFAFYSVLSPKMYRIKIFELWLVHLIAMIVGPLRTH
jgi:hypothetical protein